MGGENNNFNLSNFNLNQKEIKQNELENALDELSGAKDILQLISGTLPVGLWITDPEGNNIFSSQSMFNFLGKTQEEVLSKGWKSCIHPEDVEIMYESWRKCVSSGSRWEAEFRLMNADGKYHTVLSKAEPVKNQQGNITCWIGINLDIEERLKSEMALKESEERYRSTLDNMMEGCVIIDHNWNCIYVNEANARHAHYKREEMIGRSLFQLFPGIENSIFYEAYNRCMLERSPQYIESSYTFPDGSTAWFEVRVQPVREGIFIQSSDITERKQTEVSLQKALQQLQFHVENSPLALIEFNNEYQVIQWSKNAEKIFGWTSEEVLGKRIGEFKWVYEEDAERVANLSAKMLASEKTSNTHINRNYRKDGSVIVCEWYNSALIGSDGKLITVFSLVLDITDRKIAEESLQYTLEALKRSNTDLEQFAYVASHDLQEPLRMVSNYTRMLERQLKDSLDDKTKQYMGFIVEGAKRMHSLIQGLLSFSRITTREEELTATDLNKILKEVLQDLEIAIMDTKAEIKVAHLPIIKANALQMKQLFQNLIQNALKFKGENTPLININVERKGRTLVFSVVDNGIGINPEYFEKIFVIFHRLHDRSAYPGTGIGLSICKRIVEHHGGRIWVESEEGKGSAFHFTING